MSTAAVPEINPQQAPAEAAPTVTPQAASTNVEKRAALYAQYDQTSTPPEAQPEPVVTAPVEPAKPAEAAKPAEYAPRDAPVVQQTDATVIAQAIQQALTPLTTRLESIESRFAPPKPPEAPQKTLTSYLVEGDAEGFEKTLIDRVREAIAPSVTQDSAREAEERISAKAALERFNAEVIGKNPDLAVVEDWIASVALNKFNAHAQSTKIETYQQYVDAYKQAVTSAVEDVRKKVQQFVGVGKEEGLTTRREVISSSTLPPSPLSAQSRGEPANQPEAKVESPTDYLARRQRQIDRYRGLSPAQS